MTKQSQAPQAQTSKKSAKTPPTLRLATEAMAVADLPGGDFDLGAAPNLQGQAMRLGDPRLPVIQRQALAERIGRVQGNGHLQQVLVSARQNQTVAADEPAPTHTPPKGVQTGNSSAVLHVERESAVHKSAEPGPALEEIEGVGNGGAGGAAELLTDANLQRQRLAMQIGRSQGNYHRTHLLNNRSSKYPSFYTQNFLQRQDFHENSDPQRALAEKILAEIEAGGITVAVYAFHGVNQATEFERQAAQYAIDHQAVGFRGNAIGEGVAMEMTPSLPSVLNDLNTKINTLLARFPDLSQNESGPVPIRTLAIFTHGQRTGLQARSHGQWVYMQQLEGWVQSITPYLAPSPTIPLFACSTAGEPPTGIPFAEAMQLAMEMALESRNGSEAELEPVVWAHTTRGHTTGNIRLTEITGSANTPLLGELGHRIARFAIEQARRTGALTATQQAEIEAKGTQAMARVLRVPDNRTGARDPLNVYVREIPQMGIDKVWHDLSTQGTPNLANLELTPEAQARVAEGLLEFQARFVSELATLLQQVIALPVETPLEQSTVTEEID